MKLQAPALQRVQVATRYRRDYTIFETTYDVKVKRETQTPIFALRPTTVTLIDKDYRLVDRLKASVGLVAVIGVTTAGVVAIPVLGTYFVLRDLFGSVVENFKQAGGAISYVLSAGAEAFRSMAGEIVRP